MVFLLLGTWSDYLWQHACEVGVRVFSLARRHPIHRILRVVVSATPYHPRHPVGHFHSKPTRVLAKMHESRRALGWAQAPNEAASRALVMDDHGIGSPRRSDLSTHPAPR